MAARTRALRLDDRWREKIRTSMLINRLEGHVEGKVDMTPSQVSAALGLLKKTSPDLAATVLTTEGADGEKQPFAVNVLIGTGSTPKAG